MVVSRNHEKYVAPFGYFDSSIPAHREHLEQYKTEHPEFKDLHEADQIAFPWRINDGDAFMALLAESDAQWKEQQNRREIEELVADDLGGNMPEN